MCRGMEEGAANAALGSAREPVGGFDCACSVVLFRSESGLKLQIRGKRLAHIFNRRPLYYPTQTLYHWGSDIVSGSGGDGA